MCSLHCWFLSGYTIWIGTKRADDPCNSPHWRKVNLFFVIIESLYVAITFGGVLFIWVGRLLLTLKAPCTKDATTSKSAWFLIFIWVTMTVMIIVDVPLTVFNCSNSNATHPVRFAYAAMLGRWAVITFACIVAVYTRDQGDPDPTHSGSIYGKDRPTNRIASDMYPDDSIPMGTRQNDRNASSA